MSEERPGAQLYTGVQIKPYNLRNPRLVALHHLDAPWKPAEVEQREGRILRQGNENKEVGGIPLRYRRVLRCLYVAGP